MSYKKITKPTARRMFNMGYTIKLLPCRVSETTLYYPDHWIQPREISLETCWEVSNKFDRTVNAYEYYNCGAEVGYYTHYYVSEEDYNKYIQYQKEEALC